MLPAPVRAAIWRAYRPGQEITKDPSPAYLAAARAAIDYYNDYQKWGAR